METVLVANHKVQSKKKKIIGVVILILFAIASGMFAGMMFVNLYYKGIDYSKYTEAALRDNESEIIAKYGSSNVSDLTGVNAFIIAESKLNEKNAITLNAKGQINAMGVKQNLYTNRYKNNNSYYVENISKGKVILGIDTNIAERDYYDTASGMVKVYKGSNIQETTADFRDLNEEISFEQWKEKNGTTPLSFQPYIVSSKTINEATNPARVTLDNGKQGYYIKMSLNPTSALLYVKQIKNLSGLSDTPDFVYINLEIYLNQDGTFNKIISKEEYKVKKLGQRVSTKSEITYNFKYELTEIPTT